MMRSAQADGLGRSQALQPCDAVGIATRRAPVHASDEAAGGCALAAAVAATHRGLTADRTASARLQPDDRPAQPALSRRSRAGEFDVVVVGGGITGAGVALDAATRGYSVALLEKRRLRLRDLEPLEQARPRRPALPAELRPRPRARGAARAPADGRAGAAPRAPAAARRAGLRRRAARPAGRRRAEPLRRDVGRRALRAPARAAARRREPGRRRLEPRAPPRDLRRGGRRAAAGARRPRADQRLPVLRLPDRRRAAGADRARRGRALRRGLRQPRSR